MRARQSEYKTAALQSKRNGDTATALQFLRVVKQFNMVIKMNSDGQEVDLSDMPLPPEQFADFLAKMQVAAEASNAAGPSAEPVAPTTIAPETGEEVGGDVEAPTTVLEALQQRLNKYKSVEDSAKAEGNSSKARRYGRIVKQYEDAFKQHKAGRPVEYDELPVPPDFGPLPLENTAAKSVPNPSSKPARPAASPVSPVTSSSSDGTADTTVNTTPSAPKRASPQKEDLTTRTSGNHQKNNLAEQQMKLLLEKKKEFKLAAIEAKKAGETDQAKEYLKIYKEFDSLLNAASSGLPVDLSTPPLPPSGGENLESSFAMVTTEECDPDDDKSDIGVRIEEQLAKQLMMCKNTRDHLKAM